MKKGFILVMMVLFLFPLVAMNSVWALEAAESQGTKEEVVNEVETIREADNFIIVFDGSSSTNNKVPGMEISRISAAKKVLQQREKWMPDMEYNCGVYLTSGWSALKTVHEMQPCTQASLGEVVEQLPEKGKGSDLFLQSMLKLEKIIEPLSGKTSVIWFTDDFTTDFDDIRTPAYIAERIHQKNDVRFYVINGSEKDGELSNVAALNEESEVIPLKKLLEEPDYLAKALYTTSVSSYAEKSPVPVEESPSSVQETPVPEMVGFVTDNMLFDSDSAEIRSEYTQELDKLGNFLIENQNAGVVIQGHTDSEGEQKYNMSLSAKRAEQVRDYLLSKFKIDPERVVALWYVEQKPAADNDSNQGRQLNRRVEIAVKSLK
jgi:OOP family OmpA-OmpF porin